MSSRIRGLTLAWTMAACFTGCYGVPEDESRSSSAITAGPSSSLVNANIASATGTRPGSGTHLGVSPGPHLVSLPGGEETCSSHSGDSYRKETADCIVIGEYSSCHMEGDVCMCTLNVSQTIGNCSLVSVP